MTKYIVRYTDGTLGICASVQHRSYHQKGSKFYACDDNTTIEQISAWIAQNYPDTFALDENSSIVRSEPLD